MYTLCTVFMKNNMELVMTVFNKCQTLSNRRTKQKCPLCSFVCLFCLFVHQIEFDTKTFLCLDTSVFEISSLSKFHFFVLFA